MASLFVVAGIILAVGWYTTLNGKAFWVVTAIVGIPILLIALVLLLPLLGTRQPVPAAVSANAPAPTPDDFGHCPVGFVSTKDHTCIDFDTLLAEDGYCPVGSVSRNHVCVPDAAPNDYPAVQTPAEKALQALAPVEPSPLQP
jgi:hypothetical protein